MHAATNPIAKRNRRSTDKAIKSPNRQFEKLELKEFFSDEKILLGLVSEDRCTVLTTCGSLLKQLKLKSQLVDHEEWLQGHVKKVLIDGLAISESDFAADGPNVTPAQLLSSQLDCDTAPISIDSMLTLVNFLADIGERDLMKRIADYSTIDDVGTTAVWGLYRLNDVVGLYSLTESARLEMTKRTASIALGKLELKNSN